MSENHVGEQVNKVQREQIDKEDKPWGIIEPIYDPISKIILKKLKLFRGSRAIIFGLMLGSIMKIISPALDGLLFPRAGYISSIDDFSGFYTWLIFLPIICYYFFRWHPRLLTQVSESLANGGVLQADEKEILRTINDLWSQNLKKLWWLLVFGLALLATMLISNESFNEQVASILWLTSNPTTYYLLRFPIIFLTLYMGLFIVLQQILFVALVRRLFKQYKIRIFVLHPDGAGGLGMLGSLSLSMSYLLALMMFEVVLTLTANEFLLLSREIVTRPSYILLFIVYIIVAPLMFFLPASFAHREMDQAKKAALLEIATKAHELFGDSQKLIPQNSTIKAQAEELDGLVQIHKLAMSFPVWPFNTRTLSRFTATVLFPIVFTIMAGLIVQYVSELFL